MKRDALLTQVGRALGAQDIRLSEEVQALWSGYGRVLRVQVGGRHSGTVIVKSVEPPKTLQHPRGWNGERSHRRKTDSYEVEMNWYRNYVPGHPAECRMPNALHLERTDAGWLFVLEDLDAIGYPRRVDVPTSRQLRACIHWLATLHATFLIDPGVGLWSRGTYWHLETRPEELAAMPPGSLREAAPYIDRKLRQCAVSTLLHGDAKIANFCFPNGEGNPVAAVDFQYVGPGCGLSDLAYLLGSVWTERQCFEGAANALDFYFQCLKGALGRRQGQQLPPHSEVELCWRPLWAWAWADFERFLEGWAPNHRKRNAFSRHMTELVLEQLA